MKKVRFVFIVLSLQLFQLLPTRAFAQFTKLLDFGSTANGANPYSTPISDGTFLYGMTLNGGVNDLGTIYKIKPDGSSFTKLVDFDGTNGSNPYGSLFFDGTFLYGMTTHGATDDHGVIFKLKPDGTAYTILMDFGGTSNGFFPSGTLISDGTYFYGMTTGGGNSNVGTIFKILGDGTGYTKLFEFDYANNGGYPYGSLYSDGTFLYGMTTLDGSGNYGTIFKIKTDGTGYVKLLNFNGGATGSDPKGSLVSDGTFLYGMTYYGGSSNDGVIFKIMPDGTSFSKIVDFDYSATKGAYPTGSLIYDGTFLYGMTTQNATGNGTVFKVKTDGSTFTKLLDHDVNVNGSDPEGTLFYDGTSLYGVRSGLTTSFSGIGYLGTIFKINTDGTGYTKLLNYVVDGNSPSGSLVSDGAFEYGMTAAGGLYNYGTIFKVKPDGSGLIKLLDFDGPTAGSGPSGSLIYDGTFLYGMTNQGGANDYGVIFKIKTDGSSYTKLLDLDLTNSGAYPKGSLFSDGTFLYGMTAYGGSGGNGVIFKIGFNGSGYSKLLDFDYTNNGAYPNGSLISDGTFLYGATTQGGVNSYGILFKIKPDGSSFADILDFDSNTNGNTPNADLFYDGAFLYGMTSGGGVNGYGTVFKIKPDGTSYSNLLNFDYDNNGAYPYGSLFSDGTFLYGMTASGGADNSGSIFKIKPDGTNYNKLFDFNDGSNPQGSLISDGTFLYGMTQSGGDYGLGTFFKLTKTPFVTIANFTPDNGVVGTIITINGTDFDPVPANNIVKFNNTAAVIKSSTSTTMTVVVPVGATTGPISITTNTTGLSIADFTVTTSSEMFEGSVQSCNTQFNAPNTTNNIAETFIPPNATDKIQVSFTAFHVPDDILNVYDGPDTTSPLIISLNGTSLPADIVATGAGGELTFEYIWGDGSASTWQATISCQSTAPTISIGTQPSDFTACVGSVATFTTAASGTTNITYQWQYSPDGIIAFADITNAGGYSNASTATLSVNTAGDFGSGRYRCKINGDLAATVFTNDQGLFVNPVPAAPGTTNVSACVNSSFVLNASGGTNGQYVWYTGATGSAAITGETNSTYTTPSLAVTTTYYVSINNGTCESARTSVTATIVNCTPVITATPLITQIDGLIILNLVPLITTHNDSLDISSIVVIAQPQSGAIASIANGVLTIKYNGIIFSGTEQVTIRACDTDGNCATQVFTIEVLGDIVIYNGVSPNGKNPAFIIDHINALQDTKENTVYIFDRWENQVWHGNNYDNSSVVFTGVSDSGSDLPSGVYFYKINFSSGRKTQTGFISLRRQ